MEYKSWFELARDPEGPERGAARFEAMHKARIGDPVAATLGYNELLETHYAGVYAHVAEDYSAPNAILISIFGNDRAIKQYWPAIESLIRDYVGWISFGVRITVKHAELPELGFAL